MRALRLCVGFFLATSACGAAREGPRAPIGAPRHVRYEVAAASQDPWVLDVRATFEGGVSEILTDFSHAVRDVRVTDAGGATRAAEQRGRRWRVACDSTCDVRYRFDLDFVARVSHDDPSLAVRAGTDIVAPAALWLLRPSQTAPDAEAEVIAAQGEGAPAWQMVTPFAENRRLLVRDLAGAGYVVLGREAPSRIRVNGGVVQIAALGSPSRARREALDAWAARTAAAIDTVFGKFPVDRALVVVVPVGGAGEPTFGRALPAGGASILMYVGEAADDAALGRDWILAHEMFHLGVPSFIDEGRWLDEGLATYYEPVLRARAGLVSEGEVWSDFGLHMREGAANAAEPMLAFAEGHDRVYWGGSAFALAADVEIRRETKGKMSLDDGLRAALGAGGNATIVWPLDRFIDAIDGAVGTRVMRSLYDRTRAKRSPCAPIAGRGLLAWSGCAPDDAEAITAVLAALGVKPGADGIEIGGGEWETIRTEITRGPDRSAGLGARPRAADHE